MLRIQIIALLFLLIIICTASYAIDINTCAILVDAIYEGNVDKVKDLIDSGLDPNDECSPELEGIKPSPFTPLGYAVCTNRPKIVKILLEKGADPNKKTQESGVTPLMIAAGLGQSDVVRILLDGGADPNIKDVDELTALDYAVAKNNTEIAKLLIELKDNEFKRRKKEREKIIEEIKNIPIKKEIERIEKEIEMLESITTCDEKKMRAQIRQEKEYNVLHEKLFGANNQFADLLKKLLDPATSPQKRNIIEHILVGVLMQLLVNSAILDVAEDDKGEKCEPRSWIKVKTEEVLNKSRTGGEKQSKLKKEYYMKRDDMFAAYFFHEKYPSDTNSNGKKEKRHAVSLTDLRNHFETNKCYLEKDEYEVEDNFLFWLGITDFSFDNLGVMGWQGLLMTISPYNFNDRSEVYLKESCIDAERLGTYIVLLELVSLIQDNGIKLSKDKNNLYFKFLQSCTQALFIYAGDIFSVLNDSEIVKDIKPRELRKLQKIQALIQNKAIYYQSDYSIAQITKAIDKASFKDDVIALEKLQKLHNIYTTNFTLTMLSAKAFCLKVLNQNTKKERETNIARELIKILEKITQATDTSYSSYARSNLHVYISNTGEIFTRIEVTKEGKSSCEYLKPEELLKKFYEESTDNFHISTTNQLPTIPFSVKPETLHYFDLSQWMENQANLYAIYDWLFEHKIIEKMFGRHD